MSTSRKSWQELVGSRTHMIAASAMDTGYKARTVSYEITDGIAVIDASGVLINDEEWWDGYGYSTYGRIQRELKEAASDPNVAGILLRVNSPGGETENAFETADLIVATAAQKPVWGVADVSAFSCGYLLISGAQRVFVAPKSGGVGAIGVYCVHLDFSGALDKAGVKPTFIEDPKGKSDGHPYKPLSKEAREELEQAIEYQSGLFFGHVATRRKVDVQAIRSWRARCFNPAEAIEANLADRIGTFDNAIAQFRGYLDARKEASLFTVAASAVTHSTRGGMNPMPDEKPKADAPVTPAPEGAAPAAPAIPPEPPAAPDSLAQAREAVYADNEEVAALCAIAGVSATQVHEFIKARKSASAVRAALQTMRAKAAEETEIVSQLRPESGAAPQGKKPGDSPLVQAMTGLGKEVK